LVGATAEEKENDEDADSQPHPSTSADQGDDALSKRYQVVGTLRDEQSDWSWQHRSSKTQTS
jgi:hypothetical protein